MPSASVTENGLADVLATIEPAPTLAQMLKAARALDGVADDRVSVRFSILRNITLEPGLPAILKVFSAQAGLAAGVHLGEFDDVESQVLDESSSLYQSVPDVIAIALHLQTIAPRLVLRFASLGADEIRDLVDATLARTVAVAGAIRQRSDATILVHNFETPLYPAYGILDAQMRHGQRRTIAALNERLADAVAEIGGAYIVDVDRLVSELGSDNAIDQRYWHLARAPYTFAFQQRLAREYVAFGSALKGKAKKCLVLDCDNTLWGGVIGEDGLAGIALGATSPGSAFLEMQSAILDLYERGVLLALASKNNEADAMEVFDAHPDSLLKAEHFVAKRISWQDKATSLREIAAELNIGIDALVFVDDSPFECAFVRESLPEVTVVELPKLPSRFAHIVRSMPYFETLALSAEDRRRSEMYRADASRKAIRASTVSIDDYLRSLGLRLTIGYVDDFSIPRMAQLTQKTNQFNLTTRRYSASEIARMRDDPHWHAYYATVSDRFDDAGIIAIALVHDEEAESRIDTFLMSCRVIGRGVQHALMAEIARDAAARGMTAISGEYVATKKNDLAKSFLSECGFTERGERDGFWTKDLTQNLAAVPEWFEEVVRLPK